MAIMAKNIAFPTDPESPFLLKLFARIPSPLDYYHGVVHGLPALPENILLFTRNEGLSLNNLNQRNFHHRHILLLPLQGWGRVIVDGEVCALGPGSALLIRPYQFHHYSDLPSGPIAWLFLSFDLAESLEQVPPVRNVCSRWFWTDLAALIEAYLTKALDWSGRQVAHRLALLLGGLSGDPPQPSPEPCSRKLQADEELILQIHQLIRRTLSNPLSLSEMGRQLGLSESRLRTKFREATGYSLGEFQKTMRLQHAAHLLITKRLPVQAVANRCGWESAFSFSRAFKNYWGIPPRDFRG